MLRGETLRGAQVDAFGPCVGQKMDRNKFRIAMAPIWRDRKCKTGPWLACNVKAHLVGFILNHAVKGTALPAAIVGLLLRDAAGKISRVFGMRDVRLDIEQLAVMPASVGRDVGAARVGAFAVAVEHPARVA